MLSATRPTIATSPVKNVPSSFGPPTPFMLSETRPTSAASSVRNVLSSSTMVFACLAALCNGHRSCPERATSTCLDTFLIRCHDGFRFSSRMPSSDSWILMAPLTRLVLKVMKARTLDAKPTAVTGSWRLLQWDYCKREQSGPGGFATADTREKYSRPGLCWPS